MTDDRDRLVGEQSIATCRRCGNRLAFRHEALITEGSNLIKLDGVALCCEHPDYWEHRYERK